MREYSHSPGRDGTVVIQHVQELLLGTVQLRDPRRESES